ncbi:MAG TPA: 3-methyl-2-oxobutanoate hydroxymethyltransferase [Burkholderiales bacterium]|nr:3-methyl-2-oxobutanoate hydroxymethyltransferase [Burkholderiales bacterium]
MRITLNTLHKMAQDGEKIAMLTCYDASFALLLENAGVEVLLVGDSLGMVLQGHESTLPVTLAEMVYHTRCVARGSKRAFIVADMPFGSFQLSPQQTFANAAQLMAAGAHMVKLEGGQAVVDSVGFLTERGLPVCGHLGLTPQSVHQLGGYRVQGKGDREAKRVMQDAKMLEQAGAGMLVLEAVPSVLAKQITAKLAIPTIGIGAGLDCSGQVLVLHDMLDVSPGKRPKFVKNFLDGRNGVQAAIEAYVKEVKAKSFPGPEHSF